MNNVTNTDICTKFARDVVSGRIDVGKIVFASCTRHLHRLEHNATPGLVWDAEKAGQAVKFFELCSENTRFTISPWQAFVIGSLFGWRQENEK